MNSRIILFLSLIIFAACSNDPSNEEVLKQYLSSHNKHNLEKTLSLYHENARLLIPGQPPMDNIKTIEAWDAAIKSKLTFDGWEVRGDTIEIGKIIERNNWFQKAGISQIEYLPGTLFIFREGKIYEVREAAMTVESQDALREMFRSFLGWAYENKPNTIRKLMPNNQFNFTEENADEWFFLMDEWQLNK